MTDEELTAQLAEALHAGIPELSSADCKLIAGAALPVVRRYGDQRAAEEAAGAARLRETVARMEALHRPVGTGCGCGAGDYPCPSRRMLNGE